MRGGRGIFPLLPPFMPMPKTILTRLNPMKVGRDPSKQRKFPIKDIDLNKLSSLSTDRVWVEKTDLDIRDGYLHPSHFHVIITRLIPGVPGKSQCPKTFNRKIIRFSPIGGGYISIPWSHYYGATALDIVFPLTKRTLEEFEALNEFCILLKETLNLDKEYIPEHEQEIPNELNSAKEEINSLKEQNYQLVRQNQELTQQIQRIQNKLRKAAELEDDSE